MKWLEANKILLAVGLIGVLITVIGVSLLSLAETSKLSETSAINVIVTEVTADESLKAELEATKSKLRAMEAEISIRVLERKGMAIEINRLLTKVAELTVNQQPELTEQYSQLKNRYNRQYIELNNLKANHDALILQYEELVRVHVLCEDED